MNYPQRKCIAIDIDDTLIGKGKLNKVVYDLAKQRLAEGWEVVLWSARGKDYAQEIATKHGIADAFSMVMGKPSVIVDDKGWSWIKYTKAIHPKQLAR